MIWVTGDTHGDWVHRLNMDSFPEQKEMTKDDYVIVLGDFGIWKDTKEQRHNLNWLDGRNFTTLFIDGITAILIFSILIRYLNGMVEKYILYKIQLFIL